MEIQVQPSKPKGERSPWMWVVIVAGVGLGVVIYREKEHKEEFRDFSRQETKRANEAWEVSQQAMDDYCRRNCGRFCEPESASGEMQ